MPLSHFGKFDCNSTVNQFVAQSQRSHSAVSAQPQRSLLRVSVEPQSKANPLRMPCELICINVDEKKKNYSHDKKPGKINKKNLFRRLIKLITSDEDTNFNDSFNLAANKKHKRPKNQNRKEKRLKPVSLRDIAMTYYGMPER